MKGKVDRIFRKKRMERHLEGVSRDYTRMVNTEKEDSEIKKIGRRKGKVVKRWWSVVSHTISVALYCIDLVSDIILGKEMLLPPRGSDNIHHRLQGAVILLIILLPTLATFGVVIFKRIFAKLKKNRCLSTDPNYERTLLGIDWLREGDRKVWKVWSTSVMIVFRVDIFISYVELIIVQYKRDDSEDWKKQQRKCELKLRGEMFLEACFEALPQCIFQLYLFGQRSTVSHLQVLSFTLSIFSLCYTFMLSELKMEVDRYYKPKKGGYTSFVPEVTSHGADKTDNAIHLGHSTDASIHLDHSNSITEAEVTSDKQSTRFRIKGRHKSFALATKLKRDDAIKTPPTHITLALQLKAQCPEPEDINCTDQIDGKQEKITYTVTNTKIKSKDKRNEKLFYFCVRLLNNVVGSPTFFFTAFPAVSLFSCLFGVKFMLLYLPLLCHFIAEYWWWRPKMVKRNINASFHTLYLAFKLLLRMIIFVWLCVWYIKVMSYYPSVKRSPSIHPLANKSHSKPVNKSTCPENPSFRMPHGITSLVWNKRNRKANRFLLAIASYNMDKTTPDWETKCCQLWEEKPTTGWLAAWRRRNCAIDVAKYIFCFTFYLNIIGMVWEFIVYLLFMAFNFYSRTEKWTDARKTEDSREGVVEGIRFEVDSPATLRRTMQKEKGGEEATEKGSKVILHEEEGEQDGAAGTSGFTFI